MATAGLEEAALPEPPAQATDTGESTNLTGTPKTRAKFNKPENLPEEDAELTSEEISSLFYQSGAIRKKYGHYFGTNGRLRSTFYNLIFERLPTGQLKHREDIIASNVRGWRNAILHFEDSNKYDAKGREKEGMCKAEATEEEPSKKRKRSPAKEDGPVSQDQDKQSNPPDNNVVIGSSADEQPVSRPSAEPRVAPVPESSSESVSAGLEEALPTADSDSPPALEERACSSPSVDNDKHDNASAAGDHPDVQMTESRQDESNEPTDQMEGDHTTEEATSDASPMRQTPNTDLYRALSNFEANDLNLLDGEDLCEFTKWTNAKIHTLNLNLMQAREAGRSQKYRECVNTLITRLSTLQKACFNLEEQLETDRMTR